MGKRTWSASDDEQLRSLYKELGPKGRLGDIPGIMGRTPSSVHHRASRLGISDLRHARPRGEQSNSWRGGKQAVNERQKVKREAERRSRGAVKQRRWTETEDQRLAEICSTMSIREAAAELGRSVGSIRQRMDRLGLRGRQSWQEPGPNNHNWKGGKAASYRRMKYQLEPDQYDQLLASQDGRCAICRRSREEAATKRGFHVDHDHETGKPRGILCNRCNLMLGHAQESIETLLRGVEYLRSYGNS